MGGAAALNYKPTLHQLFCALYIQRGGENFITLSLSYI
jgi:hypothetical protein